MRRYILIIYNIIIVALSLLAALLSFLDLAEMIPYDQYVTYLKLDYTILFILVIDYLFRLYQSTDRKGFIRRNIINLIALLPVHSSFRILMLSRISYIAYLARFAKLLVITQNLHGLISKVLKTNKLLYAFYLTLSTLMICSISFYFAEVRANPDILDYFDALWFSIVTVTTVGYGDLSPATSLGRVISSILMFLGIGFTSFLTGTLATFFIHGDEQQKKLVEPSKSTCSETMIDISDLNSQQREQILSYLSFIREYKQEH